MDRQNKKCNCAKKTGTRKNNAVTYKEEEKKLAEPLAKKELPAEGYSRTGEDSLTRCDVCEGRAPNSFRVTSGESVVMQRCLHRRRYDCGRLL